MRAISFAANPAFLPVFAIIFFFSLSILGQTASAEQNLPRVQVIQPEIRALTEWKEFTGRFEAVEMVELRARVTGYLDKVHFQDGQMVEKGDLLFEIDPRPYEAAVARAEAELARMDSQLKLADLDTKRGERLLTQSAISQEEVDTRRARFQEANANVASAAAALKTAKLDLQYAKITAPVSGRISNRRVDVGNLVGSGDAGQALTTIVSLDPLHFVFDVSETEYLELIRLPEGQEQLANGRTMPTQLKLIDEKEWTREGRIDFVDNRLDENTGTLRMRVVVDNADGVLRPGLFARLRLPTSQNDEAMLIPDKAIVTDQAAKVVMIVNDEGKVVPKPVELGTLQGDMRVIRSGLSQSDRIIVEGLLRARPGTEVNAVPYQADELAQNNGQDS
ncbi:MULTISPECIES: efflux RND transporter periplasmic adaptor subunit [unclassified Methylophaga]|uniref:efflux RND transporter periplasmic adaptor subunit n=1 Tax=unclassified Methylophaga TaxID=2629249 RepID=UPI000C98B2F5|nr:MULTISPECIES: efflux RND transporter periplasmic adaptor subunit [unclassified Methylophaga]MAK66470.1 efflux transporter periplasmic adaptor subunit [Methylophaga sp.]MAY17163.1 efflux transporter periplasmic adaptor subunit [Methylophaga sp.]HAO25943.1 efflux transporter periplasmic adaptor subunit [Methylophaga sp.]HCD04165.1 efflux transporter periplasmic adaptor subunit [Methylophaga sp.]|tara:strand:+ start:669 stop:1844 length:1176 start_codon:yes stop_codon:yes gene_type:complete